VSEQTPRIRRQPIPDAAQLVVQGDEDPGVQERMARVFLRRYPTWGRYGLSAYHASGISKSISCAGSSWSASRSWSC